MTTSLCLLRNRRKKIFKYFIFLETDYSLFESSIIYSFHFEKKNKKDFYSQIFVEEEEKMLLHH